MLPILEEPGHRLPERASAAFLGVKFGLLEILALHADIEFFSLGFDLFPWSLQKVLEPFGVETDPEIEGTPAEVRLTETERIPIVRGLLGEFRKNPFLAECALDFSGVIVQLFVARDRILNGTLEEECGSLGVAVHIVVALLIDHHRHPAHPALARAEEPYRVVELVFGLQDGDLPVGLDHFGFAHLFAVLAVVAEKIQNISEDSARFGLPHLAPVEEPLDGLSGTPIGDLARGGVESDHRTVVSFAPLFRLQIIPVAEIDLGFVSHVFVETEGLPGRRVRQESLFELLALEHHDAVEELVVVAPDLEAQGSPAPLDSTDPDFGKTIGFLQDRNLVVTTQVHIHARACGIGQIGDRNHLKAHIDPESHPPGEGVADHFSLAHVLLEGAV